VQNGTPLHQAALKGHKEIVSVLLDAGCPIDVVNIEGSR
jgi:ankyrin repeat protein